MSNSSKIVEAIIKSSKLVSKYPPKFFDENKIFVSVYSMDKNIPFEGDYQQMDLHGNCEVSDVVVENVTYFYDYLEVKSKNSWFVNFADFNLFGYYSGSLFAQDELMIAEIPILACLREYCLLNSTKPGLFDIFKKKDKKKLNPLYPTTREKEICTPCLIQNVQARIKFDLEKHGIYGNAFKYASTKDLHESIERIVDPPLVNILAMEAPIPSIGEYKMETIKDIITTAYTGFASAKIQSFEHGNKEEIEIHTGTNENTGGNKELMKILQIGAAKYAGVDVLYYHSRENLDHIDNLVLSYDFENSSVEDFLDWVYEMKLTWGTSNWT